MSSDRYPRPTAAADVAIVGAGAAGLAAAIFARRAHRDRSVWLLDGARRPGAKILVSGGSRCNVTNRVVTERDFWGGRPAIVRRILRRFPSEATVQFFHGLDVSLQEEADGKLFPTSGHARDVLRALLCGVEESGASLVTSCRVTRIEHGADRFTLHTSTGSLEAASVVLATGGQSLPKSGSDGAGFEFARQLGHTIVPTTPALVPLLLDASGSPHRRLTGVSHPAELTLWLDGRATTRLTGSLLWTHFGISGPVALNASRHWLRAELEKRETRMTLSCVPGSTFDAVENRWLSASRARPTQSALGALTEWVPASVAGVMLDRAALGPSRQMARITRAERRAIVHNLVEWPLPVVGSRGYTFAEATAGGVALEEVDPATMESRICQGLYLVGEMMDVDGRIGGFNFQWAWSTAYVAGHAVARRSTADGSSSSAT